MGSLPQHDLPNTIHRRNTHDSTIQLYPKHIKAPQETPMDRAVRIAGALTNAIRIMLKGTKYKCRKTCKSIRTIDSNI